MSVYRKRITALLREHGAKLIRQSKHKVYRLPNGRNYVESSTPGAPSDLNQLSDLRKALELPNTRGQEGERREKRKKQGRSEPVKFERFEGASFAEKLRLQGVKESALQDDVDMLNYHVELLTERLKQAEAEKTSCWLWRLKKRILWT
jgi:hypothetical protein